jgi:GNAT superfamily N-acetyltransferase
MSQPVVERFTVADVTPEFIEANACCHHRAFPEPRRTLEERIDWMNRQVAEGWPERPNPAFYVVREDGRHLAQALTFTRRITVADQTLTVLALAGVCTDPDHRHKGLARAVVTAAFAPVDAGDPACALFQTSNPVQPFYEKLGATVLSAEWRNSLADDPATNPWWDDVVLHYPANFPWPAGPVDLQGPAW